MKAMVLREARQPLVMEARAIPEPLPGQIRVRVEACAICRTDLHVVDGELPNAKLPLVPGHEIISVVEATGLSDAQLLPGARVGIPWLGHTCGCLLHSGPGKSL